MKSANKFCVSGGLLFFPIFKTDKSLEFGMFLTNICGTYYCLKNAMLGTMGWPKIWKIYDFDDLIVLEMTRDIMLLDS